jgi:hypothetical protein
MNRIAFISLMGTFPHLFNAAMTRIHGLTTMSRGMMELGVIWVVNVMD